MKRVLVVITLVIVILAAAAYVYRDAIGFAVARMTLTPDHDFSAERVPTPPDYSQDTHWAALPGRTDGADTLPDASLTLAGPDAQVDVFFLHPTTYYNAAGWNQPLDDAGANFITDRYVMSGQAAVFNSCCWIYAPRYRQATLAAYFDDGDSGREALDLAYADALAAFEYFLSRYNQGRPFVLAAHSQGSQHLRRLLEERITGTALLEQLVAVYPIGYNLERPDYLNAVPDVPICDVPSQTGCLVTWNTVGPDAVQFRDSSRDICVNPLSWRADSNHADHVLNLGAVSYGGRSLDPADDPPFAPLVEPGAADGRCTDGQLVVSELRSDRFPEMMGRDQYHIYDYSLYHMNIRDNVAERIAAFLER